MKKTIAMFILLALICFLDSIAIAQQSYDDWVKQAEDAVSEYAKGRYDAIDIIYNIDEYDDNFEARLYFPDYVSFKVRLKNRYEKNVAVIYPGKVESWEVKRGKNKDHWEILPKLKGSGIKIETSLQAAEACASYAGLVFFASRMHFPEKVKKTEIGWGYNDGYFAVDLFLDKDGKLKYAQGKHHVAELKKPRFEGNINSRIPDLERKP